MSSILQTNSNISYHNNHHHHHHKRRAKTPSFSSTLLDAIYRSIDEEHHHHHHHHGEISTSPTHGILKQTNVETDVSEFVQQRRTKMRSDGALESIDLRRAIMIESWMEKQPHQQPPHIQSQKKHHFHLGEVLDQKVKILRQKSVPSRVQETYNNNNNNSSSLSSSSCFTNLASRSSRDQSSSRIFTKTKSRAMKIYGDLKKPKSQNSPVSPGRRIAAFLNSIFRNTSNSPATNPSPSAQMAVDTRMTTSNNSTCSTGSSFSRLCLSHKTSSSSSKSTPADRTKLFYHKSLHNNNENESSNKKLVSPRHVNGGDLEQQKWREKDMDALMMMIKSNCGNNIRFNEDIDEDEGSCASSDLFELENFSSIRYYEELPVYGTTSFKNIMA